MRPRNRAGRPTLLQQLAGMLPALALIVSLRAGVRPARAGPCCRGTVSAYAAVRLRRPPELSREAALEWHENVTELVEALRNLDDPQLSQRERRENERDVREAWRRLIKLQAAAGRNPFPPDAVILER